MTAEAAKQNIALERVAQQLPTEFGATAAAAQTRALVEARFVLAVRNPRKYLQVRSDLLKECSRPSFALEDEEGKGNSALYRKPLGNNKFAEGLGIRFAEVAARCYGNLLDDAFTVQEDEKLIVKYCYVLDLEKNVSWGDTVRISKTVERRYPRDGDEILSVRTNSAGEKTYTIIASEDALAVKEGALISKKMRTLILRMIPGDLQEECINEIKRVRREKINEDPDAALHRVVDGMARQNVNVIMLEEYLDHPIQQITPAEILNLQALYGALRDGETTWSEILANVEEYRKRKPEKKGAADAAAASEQKASSKDKGVDAVKEKIKQDETKKSTKAEQKASQSEPASVAPAPERKSAAGSAATAESQPTNTTDATQQSESPAPAPPPKPQPEAAPAPPAKPAPEVADTATEPRHKIRNFIFPDDLVAGDKPSKEQKDEVKAECERLGINAGTFVQKRLGVDFDQLNAESVAKLIEVLKSV